MVIYIYIYICIYIYTYGNISSARQAAYPPPCVPSSENSLPERLPKSICLKKCSKIYSQNVFKKSDEKVVKIDEQVMNFPPKWGLGASWRSLGAKIVPR